MKMDNVLVTGAAGFIGFHTVRALLGAGYNVVGLDNLNSYYDVNLKYARLEASGIARSAIECALEEGAGNGRTNATGEGYYKPVKSSLHEGYQFVRMDIEDQDGIMRLFASGRFDYVIHLAAQAGVRYSLVNPHAYISANITGFLNVLEACRAHRVKHLLYASSSSVYGKNTRMPFSASDNVDHPVSLYAASKKANELMAHSYSHLYGIPATGLRFFTVYGPWGRPDMALFIFTRAILEDRPIEVFNHGEMLRDFTYVDDIVEGIRRIMVGPALANPAWLASKPDPSSSDVPHRVYNIGNSKPAKLMDFISALEKALGKSARIDMLPMQPGDVPATYADTGPLERDFGYRPGTPLEKGIKAFVDWYRGYYGG